MPPDFNWVEELPVNCPPPEAIPPAEQEYYRLVSAFPPTDRDFWSYRKLYPTKRYNLPECIVRSCSLTSTIERAKELSLLPLGHGKRIAKVLLPPTCGVVLKTTKNPAHYSWWQDRGFDPVAICIELVDD